MKCCSVLGSSELPSFTLSKLSIRQVPRLHISISMCASATCGSTTAKGLYANLFYVLTHYAFGGVSAVRALRAQHSTSTSGSNRRVPPPRGSSSPVHLGHRLLPALAVGLLSCTRRFLTPRSAACGSTFPVGPLSLLHSLRHPSCGCLSA